MEERRLFRVITQNIGRGPIISEKEEEKRRGKGPKFSYRHMGGEKNPKTSLKVEAFRNDGRVTCGQGIDKRCKAAESEQSSERKSYLKERPLEPLSKNRTPQTPPQRAVFRRWKKHLQRRDENRDERPLQEERVAYF